LAKLIRTIALCPVVVAFVLGGMGSTAQGQASPKTADLVLTHARVYTVNSQQPWAEAIAMSGDKIVAVGSVAEIEHYRGPTTKVIDVDGKLVLPGFTDCHIHFLDGSLSLERIYLDDAQNIQEIQRRVKTYAEAHPKQPWVLGRGWQYSSVGPTNLPDKKYLDEIIADRPVYLESYDGHTWWANSKAMQLAGIKKETPNPAGGEIVRDSTTRDHRRVQGRRGRRDHESCHPHAYP
jgi:predicted amidohydrolase YtcJ